MTITTEQASAYIENKTFDVGSLLDAASVLVDDYVGSVPVPEAILDMAVLRVVQRLALQHRSPTGQPVGDQVVRVKDDPMVPARDLLRPWCGGFA